MKNFIFKTVFFLGLLTGLQIFGQCPNGNVSFTSQEQINQFLANYPNCTQIAGNLTIMGAVTTSNINSLLPLANITNIGGNLTIANNALLSDLNGLQNLQNIGGTLEIFNAEGVQNPLLSDLSALSGLVYIGRTVYIKNIPLITNVNAFSNITSLRTALIIEDNANLTNLNGFSNITHLTDLPLEGLGFGIVIGGNPLLTSVSFQNLMHTTNLVVYDSPLLTTINMPFLERIDYRLELNNNAQLTNLNGFSLFTNIGNEDYPNGGSHLIVRNNPLLMNLNAFSNLTNVNYQIRIENNASLTDISGLDNVNHLNLFQWANSDIPELIIKDNPNLAPCNTTLVCNLLAIENTTPSLNLSISNNAVGCGSKIAVTNVCNNITDCTVQDFVFNSQQQINQFILDYPFCTQINGNVTISNVTNLSPLQNIIHITGNVSISSNNNLLDLGGLNNLQSIGGNFAISNNNAMNNLNALSNLQTIGGVLTIQWNFLLNDIAGINGINVNSVTNLIITNNPALSFCSEPLICDYLENGGSATISNNALGCNSVLQVETVCLAGSICPVQNDVAFFTQAGLYNFIVTYPYCNEIQGNLTITGDDITDLTPLQNITAVGGGIYIVNNLLLTELNGLHNIDKDSFTFLEITDNPLLSVCGYANFCEYLLVNNGLHNISGNAEGCDNLLQITAACGVVLCPQGDVHFATQTALNNFLADYPHCTTLSGRVNIVQQGVPGNLITDLSPLQNIIYIRGNLRIIVTNLANLSGLDNLKNIGGSLQIGNNSLLQNMEGLNALETVGFSGVEAYSNNVEISFNPVLQSFEGLYSLYSIKSYLSISNNSALTDFTGLSALESIGGALTIENNADLENLEGLGLKYFDNSLATKWININNNPNLQTLEGLEDFDVTTMTSLLLNNNPNLSMCSIPNICEYLHIVGPGGANISGNTGDCFNRNAVENDCPTIWDGDQWNIGEPDQNRNAIIDGDLTTDSNLTAKNFTVNSGVFTLSEGNSLTLNGKIENTQDAENFIVESNGIILQTTDVVNTGAITVKRQSSPMFRLDYTLWSSPVEGMRLVDFSDVSPTGGNGTIWNRVYELGVDAWEQVWNIQPDFNNDNLAFEKAKGYLYRAKNNWVTRDSGNPALPFTGEFTGIPNNGEININTLLDFNAIGNPYPSPIYADDFLTLNTGTLYFWTNVNAPVNGSYAGINNWAYYQAGIGGTGVNGEFEPADNMLIQPGQGFVIGTQAASVEFNNSMRRTSNGAFFRQMNNEKHRFWLNLSNEEVIFNQILVGYIENATQGADTGIDAKMFAYQGNALYSLIENSEEKFVIQGRALPFSADDVVPLGFRAVNAGSFSISLNNFDGIFEEPNIEIYLKDNFSQTLNNLSNGAYTFLSEEGIFDTRFEVVYQTTMSMQNTDLQHEWIVYRQDKNFQIQTNGFELKEISVYDMQGRKIYTSEAEKTTHTIPNLGADGIYIVKITTTEDKILNKKVR